MIKTKHLISSLILLSASALLSVKLFPNGGTFGSSLKSSGNILLKNTPNVNLISEKLFIKPVGNYVHVDVKYELNNTGEELDVNYGFPFYQLLNILDWPLKFSDQSNKSVKYFDMQLNGNSIKTSKKIDEGSDAETLWYIAKLKLKKGINILNINYESQAYYQDSGTSKSPMIDYGKRQFIYNFRPAGTWGDGTVCDLDITIDSVNILNTNGKIDLSGFSFTKESNRYYKTKVKDIDLKKSDMLTITYDISSYNKEIEKNIYNLKKSNSIENIKASSILKETYSANNLIDGNYLTAWADGVPGKGINENIEIKFKDSSNIKTLYITNGYQKTSDIYFSNSRPKKLKLELDIISYNKKILTEKIIELSDIPKDWFMPFYSIDRKNNIHNNQALLISPYDFDYEYSIKSVKITILEVYPGTKYEDTCISEIIAF